MTSYIARSGGEKKKNLLRQRELALRDNIHREVSEEKLQRSAQKVRLVQLGVIKALLHEADPARSEDEELVVDALQRLRDAEEYWTHVLVAEIIEMYSADGDGDVFIGRKKWWDFRSRTN